VYSVKLTQPLFQPALQRYQTAQAHYQTQATAAQRDAMAHQVTGKALNHYLQVLSLSESRKADLALQRSLEARRERVNKELQQGSALKTDLLQLDVEIVKLAAAYPIAS